MCSQRDSGARRGLFGKIEVVVEGTAEDGSDVCMVAFRKKVVLPVLLPTGWVRQLQENKDCCLGSDVQPIAASDATAVSAFYELVRIMQRVTIYHFATTIRRNGG